MAKYEVKLPQMGESVAEATITNWVKNIGDTIELDETIVEVATDKVDSEIPSEVEGTLVEIICEADTVAKVGQTIAIIEIEGEETTNIASDTSTEQTTAEVAEKIEREIIEIKTETPEISTPQASKETSKFFSPLVRSIAQKEGISIAELEAIVGTGTDSRVTKYDILDYLKTRKNTVTKTHSETVSTTSKLQHTTTVNTTPQQGDEIIEMSRMGKLISKHMTDSKRTSAHVQSFIEVDVTNIVKWRNRVKDDFLKREGEKITFTPIFMQLVAKTIKQYPLINISVKEDTIIKHNDINLGMAAALPDGNLIVPVIKKADQLNLIGMTKTVNDLAKRARNNQLKPDEIQNGTYTVTNVGSFGSITGTPIINQPQVAILALGAIIKKPAVIETPDGDFIGIRHKMIIAHSYDHRVVNGAMGGMFIKTLKDFIEAWDPNMSF